MPRRSRDVFLARNLRTFKKLVSARLNSKYSTGGSYLDAECRVQVVENYPQVKRFREPELHGWMSSPFNFIELQARSLPGPCVITRFVRWARPTMRHRN